jgi:hypothetical protein
MLKRVKAEIGLTRCIRMPVDSNYAALFAKLVGIRVHGAGVRDQGWHD